MTVNDDHLDTLLARLSLAWTRKNHRNLVERAESETHVGFTQTVANLNCAASRHRSSMSLRVASGLSSV